MGQHTDIQWCDSTINPTTGCDGCELKVRGRKGTCYAAPIHEKRLARSMPDLYAADFHEIRLAPGRTANAAAWPDLRGKGRPDKPWMGLMPRVIFVGDMGDLFSKDVPFNYVRDEVFAAIRSPQGRRHIWMVLTKQPKRFADFARNSIADWPPNLVSGTSVTTQATTGRVRDLLGVPGHRFVSVEPMWEPIDLTQYLDAVGLVIAGGESGDGSKPCEFRWLRRLRDDCAEHGTSYFLKQLGSKPYGEWKYGNPPTYCLSRMRGGVLRNTTELSQYENGRWRLRDGHGGNWDEWPDDLKIRQFPAIEV